MNKQLNVVRAARIVIATIAIVSSVVGLSRQVTAGGSAGGPRSASVVSYTTNGGSAGGPR